MIFVGTYVLPVYEEMLFSFKMKLPWISEFILWAGRHTLLIVGVPLVLLFIGVLVQQLWLSARRGAAGFGPASCIHCRSPAR